MSKMQAFIKRSLIGGVLVILPIAILVFFFRWIFRLVTDLLKPASNILIQTWELPMLAADLLAIVIILLICFFVGTIVSTSLGKWIHDRFDRYLARLAPGYRMVKEIVTQFLGDKGESAMSKGQVARARIFGPEIETSVTALVTSKHADGTYTLFVPTGPNPTSGFIYHLPAQQVDLYPDIKVDSALRTVISCGVGSDELFRKSDARKTSNVRGAD